MTSENENTSAMEKAVEAVEISVAIAVPSCRPLYTWEGLLKEEMRHTGDTIDDVVFNTLDDIGMKATFEAGNSRTSFTAWTARMVYIVMYDRDEYEYVRSVPRHPETDG